MGWIREHRRGTPGSRWVFGSCFLFSFFVLPGTFGPKKRDYMGVSKNNSTPKSSTLIGFSIRNHPFWGPTPIFGNIHIWRIPVCSKHLSEKLKEDWSRKWKKPKKIREIERIIHFSGSTWSIVKTVGDGRKNSPDFPSNHSLCLMCDAMEQLKVE